MGGSKAFRENNKISGGVIASYKDLDRVDKPWNKLSKTEKRRMIVTWVKQAWNQPGGTWVGIATDNKSTWIGHPQTDREVDLYTAAQHGPMSVDLGAKGKEYSDYLAEPALSVAGVSRLDAMVKNFSEEV